MYSSWNEIIHSDKAKVQIAVGPVATEETLIEISIEDDTVKITINYINDYFYRDSRVNSKFKRLAYRIDSSPLV